MAERAAGGTSDAVCETGSGGQRRAGPAFVSSLRRLRASSIAERESSPGSGGRATLTAVNASAHGYAAAIVVLATSAASSTSCGREKCTVDSPPGCGFQAPEGELPEDTFDDAGIDAPADDGDCGSPFWTYQCESVPPDAAACAGSTANGAVVFYPIGCVAAKPECPIECTCTALGNAQAAFVCAD